MNLFIIALCICLALFLFIVELFLVPGTSLAGFLAAGCALYGIYYAFVHLGTTAGLITVLVTAVLLVLTIIAFMRSKALDRVSLHSEIDSNVANEDAKYVEVGDTGVTTTRLTLIGQADIGGHIVEVKSADGFLDAKTPVRVTRIADGYIMVEKI